MEIKAMAERSHDSLGPAFIAIATGDLPAIAGEAQRHVENAIAD